MLVQHPQYVPPEPGQEYRHNDALDVLWNMLDRTPEGRGDFHPKLEYIARTECRYFQPSARNGIVDPRSFGLRPECFKTSSILETVA